VDGPASEVALRKGMAIAATRPIGAARDDEGPSDYRLSRKAALA
jgi:hypothetical protein